MSTQIEAAPGLIQTIQQTFTRPADTNAYTIGDLVANSVTALSVVPMAFQVDVVCAKGKVRRARIAKSNATLTLSQFRLHLYSSAPTPTNGDNGVWLTTTSGYLGSLSLGAAMGRAFSDGAEDIAVPDAGVEVIFANLAGPNAIIYGLLEARAAYVPASAEAFTVTLEIAQI